MNKKTPLKAVRYDELYLGKQVQNEVGRPGNIVQLRFDTKATKAIILITVEWYNGEIEEFDHSKANKVFVYY